MMDLHFIPPKPPAGPIPIPNYLLTLDQSTPTTVGELLYAYCYSPKYSHADRKFEPVDPYFLDTTGLIL